MLDGQAEERARGTFSEAAETDDLVARCLAGDETAWCDLVARYKNLVFAVIRRSGAANGEEADLHQAIWLDIYRSLGSLRSHSSVRFWIATLARH